MGRRRVVTRAIALVTMVVGLSAASPAAASELSFLREEDDRSGFTELFIVYSADRGESNDVTVAPVADGFVRFTDPGAVIRFGPLTGCRRVHDHRVDCPRKGYDRLTIKTLDGADRVRVEKGDRPVALVRSGAGDDIISLAGRDDVRVQSDTGVGGAGADRLLLARGSSGYGAGGDDVLSGGARRNVLYGGPGSDRLRGGSGDDYLEGDEGDDLLQGIRGNDFLQGDVNLPRRTVYDDRLEGGPGRDAVGYGDRALPVVVKLNDGKPDGSKGEQDVLSSVEDAFGALGDDLIVGDSGDNYLDGESGDDLLFGGAGADGIRGGTGRDRLRGGPEADRLEAEEGLFVESKGRRDDVSCGGGQDTVVRPKVDRLEARCEKVSFEPPLFLAGDPRCVLESVPAGRVAKRRLRFGVWCTSDVRLRLKLGTRAAPLGSGERTVAPFEKTSVTIRLTASGVHRLRRRREVRVEGSALVRDPDSPFRISYTIRFPGF